jgi:stage III sporulation protein AF
MEWIREWIWRIAGIIILASICDIIMIEGELKKYVKPILGFVLILTILSPIVGSGYDKIKIESVALKNNYKFYNEMQSQQNKDVAYMYEKRLADALSNEIKEEYGIESVANVKTEAETYKFGKIISADIRIYVDEDKVINCEQIREFVSKKIDLQKTNITISLEGKG